jgi:predicted DNA-binding transcriptional regulator AlpA
MTVWRPPIPAASSDIDDGTDTGLGPLLLTAKQAAVLCAKSLRTWRTWDSAGWIPRPVRIGRSTMWRLDELREWAAAGCPRRNDWEARS